MNLSNKQITNPLTYGLLIVFLITLACAGTTPTDSPEQITATSVDEEMEVMEISPTNFASTLTPTSTKAPTKPSPTRTTVPPTSTPDPNLLKPGTYLVGKDIIPGLYIGQTGYDLFDSCYWERLKDLTGSVNSILANDNSIGKYYIEVKQDDFALKTSCELRFLPSLPEPPDEYPSKIMPGMYLIGIDILPGTYRGEAGLDFLDSCYWSRLRNVAGDLSGIIANDNSIGQYFIQVLPSDYALLTHCELNRLEE